MKEALLRGLGSLLYVTPGDHLDEDPHTWPIASRSRLWRPENRGHRDDDDDNNIHRGDTDGDEHRDHVDHNGDYDGDHVDYPAVHDADYHHYHHRYRRV